MIWRRSPSTILSQHERSTSFGLCQANGTLHFQKAPRPWPTTAGPQYESRPFRLHSLQPQSHESSPPKGGSDPLPAPTPRRKSLHSLPHLHIHSNNYHNIRSNIMISNIHRKPPPRQFSVIRVLRWTRGVGIFGRLSRHRSCPIHTWMTAVPTLILHDSVVNLTNGNRTALCQVSSSMCKVTDLDRHLARWMRL